MKASKAELLELATLLHSGVYPSTSSVTRAAGTVRRAAAILRESANDQEPEQPNSVQEIVTAWLKEHGFDGLAGDDCGCFIANLMPCGQTDLDNCVPGRCEGEIIVPAKEEPWRRAN